MLAHTYRFHGHGSLKRLYRDGRVVRRRTMNVRYYHNMYRVHSRVTVIISKKVFKAATKRNRLRRRLYEIIRTHWPEIVGAHDIALTVVEGSLLTLPPAELEREVVKLLHDAHLLETPVKEGEHVVG